MKILITIILSLIVCVTLFFIMGLLYIGIYGTGGEYNVNKVFIFECIYFLIGIIHVYLLYLKMNKSKSYIFIYAIIFLAYLYMAFFYGK